MTDWILLGVTFVLASAVGALVPTLWFMHGVCW